MTTSSDSFLDTLRRSGMSRSLHARVGLPGANQQPMVLRRLARDGGFVRTVKCMPGKLTIIADEGDETSVLFREVLTGRSNSPEVQIRYGSRTLHPSEIFIVGRSDRHSDHASLQEFLTASGAPLSVHTSLLAAIGLEHRRSEALNQLTAGERRRLAVVASFFSKARVLVFDEPFVDAGQRWEAAVAKLLLDGAAMGEQILIVTGLDDLPRAWRGHPLIQLDDPHYEDQESAEGEQAGPLYNARLQELLQENRTKDQPSYFVTRPLMIHNLRGHSEDTFKAEQIVNPHLEGSSDEAAAPVLPVENGPRTSSKRVPTGTLTKVTGVHRFRRTPLGLILYDHWRRLQKPAQEPNDSVTVAFKLEMLKWERRRINQVAIYTAIVLALALFLLSFHW